MTCYKIVNHRFFDSTILIFILISSVLLILDNPLLDPKSQQAETLKYFNYSMTAIFTIEMIIKIITWGFILNGPKSYLKNWWNDLDFLVVIISLIDNFLLNEGNMRSLKILRIFRILRPLRVVSRNQGMKLVVGSLLQALPFVVNVMVVSSIFFLIFGIFGVNYFKGDFFYCDLDSVPEDVNISIKWKQDCMNIGGDWLNKSFNYDNVMNAMISLFAMSTTEGWV